MYFRYKYTWSVDSESLLTLITLQCCSVSLWSIFIRLLALAVQVTSDLDLDLSLCSVLDIALLLLFLHHHSHIRVILASLYSFNCSLVVP